MCLGLGLLGREGAVCQVWKAPSVFVLGFVCVCVSRGMVRVFVSV